MKPAHAEHLEDCVKEEEYHVTVPLATWVMIFTAISFAVRTEKTRDWISPETHQAMMPDPSFIGSQSGLSALLFSVNGQKRETKDKIRRPEGRLWSYTIRNAIASLFNYSSSHLFVTKSSRTGESVCKQPGRSGPMAPSWLLELYPREKGLGLVSQVVAKLEKTDAEIRTSDTSGKNSGTASKKRKLNSEDASSIHAVKHTRKITVDKLNYGRCNGREYLYNNLIFLVDRICYEYGSVSEAKDAGYAIEFVDFGFESDGRQQESPHDMWDISDANTDTLKQYRTHSKLPQYTAKDQENISAVQNLITDHPWLFVKMIYKLRVKRPGSAAAGARRADTLPELFFNVEEWLSLHSVALGFYMEIFKKEDPKFLLSCSRFSIKAVHVIAIALRAALRHVLGLEVTDEERAALGNVEVFPEGDEDDDADGEGNVDHRAEREGNACISIVRKMSKSGNDRTRYEKLRDSLFDMPWANYLEAQRERDEAERRRNESSMSESVLIPDIDEAEGFDPAAL